MGRVDVCQIFRQYMFTFYGNVAGIAGCILYVDNMLEKGLRDSAAVDKFCFEFREITNSEDEVMKIVKAIKNSTTTYFFTDDMDSTRVPRLYTQLSSFELLTRNILR
ncbi:hypothetical protein QYF36_007709 [Acer negundo]|nr:hypothetical protein QYF36_007709 [Acer negundo]